MRYVLLGCLLLAGCSTPQAPVPIAPIPKVDFKPLQRRIDSVKDSNRAIGAQLDDTRAKLDASINAAHEEKIDREKLNRTLDETSAALTATHDLVQAQFEQITGLQIDKNAAEEDADRENLAGNNAVTRANTAEGKVYKYELQQKEDEGNWGLNGVWRWTKHLGWRVIFLIAGIGIITALLRIFAPAVIPIFTGLWAGVLWAVRGLWRILSRLWRKGGSP